MKPGIPIGLAGFAGAGKDTTFDRLVAIGGEKFERHSVADPLKESIAALFDVTLDQLEAMKRSESAHVMLDGGREAPEGSISMSMRKFMQRYGTEAHRDVFGEDFWLDVWKRDWSNNCPAGVSWVNTSVRFENEARAIIEDLGGEVWWIEGPRDAGADGRHESEHRLPEHLITRVIDNSVRTFQPTTYLDLEPGIPVPTHPCHRHLDDQLASILYP